MSKEGCPLCERKKEITGWYYVTLCKACRIPMIVSVEHKPEFSKKEKQEIKKLFSKRSIRWKQRKISSHAHAHLME